MGLADYALALLSFRLGKTPSSIDLFSISMIDVPCTPTDSIAIILRPNTSIFGKADLIVCSTHNEVTTCFYTDIFD